MPEKTYSGQISLRTTPELHKLMAVAAAQNRQSLNSWLEQAARISLESGGLKPDSSLSVKNEASDLSLLTEIKPQTASIAGASL